MLFISKRKTTHKNMMSMLKNDLYINFTIYFQLVIQFVIKTHLNNFISIMYKK